MAQHVETTVAVDTDVFASSELAEMMRQRAATYSLLARLYRVEVDQPLLDELKRRTFPLDTGSAPVDEGYRLIAGYLRGAWEGTLKELAVDYVRVFIGHGLDMHSAAYPFESVHTSKRRLLMQEARDEVLALYHAAGIVKQDSWHEGEDHIALELEYMQILCERTAQSLESGDEAGAAASLRCQLNFLDDHLLNWVPMLVSGMKELAGTDLYRGLAFLTEGYLEADREFVGEMLGTEQADAERASAERASAEQAATQGQR